MGWERQIEVAGVRRTGSALALLRASHPEPTVMVTALAVALAVSTGRDAAGVVAAGAAVLAGQLSVGWHNDWLDAGRDAASGRPDKPVAAGDISPRLAGRARPPDGGAPGLGLQRAAEGDRRVLRPVRGGVPAAGRLRDAGRSGGLVAALVGARRGGPARVQRAPGQRPS